MLQLKDLAPNQPFLMPWRKRGKHIGRLLSKGLGSATVHLPKRDGTWERTNIALETQIEEATEEMFASVYGGSSNGGTRNRSSNESPVQTVWDLCDENPTATRDEIIARAIEKGVNVNTARTQYYKWRRENK